jgi:uncharacterized phage protein gp47/JayE
MSDSQGALCFLTLEYVDWLAFQLLPDTAETEWLDRHGNIWLVNADGTIGRKQATLATGIIAITGTQNTIVPSGAVLGVGSLYQTTKQVIIGAGPTNVTATALNAGSVGNMNPEDTLAFVSPVPGLDPTATVIIMDGGADTETDDELRARILQRIRQPPMGGDQNDYVAWAEAVPGVTRAWCSPLEMGIGTVTVRFMMDDLRADNNGFPNQNDVQAVTAYLDSKRPVAVKDFFVVAPIQQPINFTISELVPNTEAVRAEIEQSIQTMLFEKAAPGQTIYASWKNYAVMSAPDIISYHLDNNIDDVMQTAGNMAILGSIYYV